MDVERRTYGISPDWALTTIALGAFVVQWFYPQDWVVLESGRLLAWPQFAVAVALLVLWFVVWARWLRPTRGAGPLALITLVVTAWPVLSFGPHWSCVIGTCFW